MSVSEIINAVAGIEGKRYLELGVAGRMTFDAVHAVSKVGVDILGGGPNVHQMTTDEFFEIEQQGSFDVVFIDACHDYPQVLRDYNNAARCCPDGVIFLHDMVPPSVEFTARHLCSDAYKLLGPLLRGGHEVKVMDGDYGLTAVLKPQPVVPHPDWGNLSYDEFIAIDLPLISPEEMMRAVVPQGVRA